MNADIVIIGSGVAGLTAAAILARKGFQVVILEKQAKPGGSLRQFSRKGIGFDVGFHYTGCLGDGEILQLLWAYCDVADKVSKVSLAESGYDLYQFPHSDRAIRGFFDYTSLASELKSQFPKDAGGIDKYLHAVRTSCENIPFYNTSLPLTPFLRGMRPNGTPLRDVLDQYIDDVYLKAVFEAPAFLYGVPITRASFESHAMVAHGYYSGAYTLRDGGQAVVDAFLASLAEKGVEILTGTALKRVLVEGGEVSGVETADGERISCSKIIYTGHPAGIVDMVPQKIFRPGYCKRLKGLSNTLSMFGVFGVGEKVVDPLHGALNYYYLPSPENILPESAETPHGDRPLLLTGTRNGQDDILQARGNGIILLRPGYWQEVDGFSTGSPHSRKRGYREYKARVTDEMVAQAERLWHEQCGAIQPLATGTPLTFCDELSAPEGCTYGAMHCLDQFNPDIRTRLPGLYLGGQSTLMTGVVGASISALVAAGEITGLEPLWEEVKKCH